MAQLVERFLPTPEDPGLNPVIGKQVIFNVYCIEKMKIKKYKEAGNGPLRNFRWSRPGSMPGVRKGFCDQIKREGSKTKQKIEAQIGKNIRPNYTFSALFCRLYFA